MTGTDAAPPPVVELLWRVAQEAVRNVARHSGAARMSLTVRHEGDRIVLEVVDDGVGYARDVVVAGDHFGLRAAESLVREHDGTLDVESAPGEGTVVRMEVPVG